MRLLQFTFAILVVSFHAKAQSLPDSLYPPDTLSITYQSAWTKVHYPERIIEFKKVPLEKNDIVFLGNSLTEQGGNWGKRLNWSHVKNRGISGDVTEGVLNRLDEISYTKPKIVFLLIGINDIFNTATTPEYVANTIIEIVAIIRKNSPHTKLYVQTILPTTTTSIKEKIKQTNMILRRKANIKTYTFLNIHALFADKNDVMKNEYTQDGVHLNEEGYTIWADYLKKKFTSLNSQ